MQKQTLVQEECAMCLYINKWPNPALGHCSAAAHGEIAWAEGKQPGQQGADLSQPPKGNARWSSRHSSSSHLSADCWQGTGQSPGAGKESSEPAQAGGAPWYCMAHSQCSSAGHCSVHLPLLSLLCQGLLCATFQQWGELTCQECYSDPGKNASGISPKKRKRHRSHKVLCYWYSSGKLCHVIH